MTAFNPVIIGNATLYLGDSREIVPTLDSPHAIVSDPPYGIGFKHSGGGKSAIAISRADTIHGDDVPFDPSFLYDCMPKRRGGRVGKMLLFGANHYAKRLPDGGEWLVWDKSPRGVIHDSFRDTEYMWCSTKTPRTIYRHHWKGLVREGEEHPGKQKRLHVSQKPVALMMWCIETVGVPVGGTVLDPFMGSGSTGVAALRKGLDFVGIEYEKEHFDTACQRLANEQGIVWEGRATTP